VTILSILQDPDGFLKLSFSYYNLILFYFSCLHEKTNLVQMHRFQQSFSCLLIKVYDFAEKIYYFRKRENNALMRRDSLLSVHRALIRTIVVASARKDVDFLML
jgi:hypothetical protein